MCLSEKKNFYGVARQAQPPAYCLKIRNNALANPASASKFAAIAANASTRYTERMGLPCHHASQASLIPAAENAGTISSSGNISR